MSNGEIKEYEGEPAGWLERLRAKIRVQFGWWSKPMFTVYPEKAEEDEAKAKLNLLYDEIMKDIQASAAPDGIKKGLDPLPAIIMLLLSATGGAALGMIMGSLLAPYISAKLTYAMNRQAMPFRLDPNAITQLWLRGFPDETQKEKWWSNLVDQGWSPDQIKAAKELAHYIPPIQDVIRFAVREVYTPEIAEKFGQFEDYPTKAEPDAAKVGIMPEVLKKYWAAHWDLPGASAGYEMLRRGLITEDELKVLLRALDVMPFWRDKLAQMAWEIPTRVDVRRFREMGTISKDELRAIYVRQGYHGKDLDDYVLWTEVYNHFPDLMARYQKGWITLDDVKHQLVDIDGMSVERFEELLQTKISATVPDQTIEARELTKSEILKGVKLGRLSYKEGKALLVAMNYTEDNAAFLLDIYAAPAEVIEKQVAQKDLTAAEILSAIKAEILSIGEGEAMLMGLGNDQWESDVKIMLKLGIVPEESVSEIGASSPQTPLQYRRLVESYRKSVGLEAKEIPTQLLDLEKESLELRSRLSQMRSAGAPQDQLDQLQADLAEAETRLREMKLGYGL